MGIGGLEKGVGERFTLYLATGCAVQVVGSHGAAVPMAALDQHRPEMLVFLKQ